MSKAIKVILFLLISIVTGFILAAIELHFGGITKYLTVPLSFIIGMITAHYIINIRPRV